MDPFKEMYIFDPIAYILWGMCLYSCFFYYVYPVFPASFVWKITLSPLNYLGIPVENQLFISEFLKRASGILIGFESLHKFGEYSFLTKLSLTVHE